MKRTRNEKKLKAKSGDVFMPRRPLSDARGSRRVAVAVLSLAAGNFQVLEASEACGSLFSGALNAWMTRGCAAICGRSDVICALRDENRRLLREQCGDREGEDHFCVLLDSGCSVECIAARKGETGEECAGGQVFDVDGEILCIGDGVFQVERRLQSGSSSGEEEDESASGSGESDDKTSLYVLAALAGPFLYFLYKLGLFFFFLKTYPRLVREQERRSVDNGNADAASVQVNKHELHDSADDDTQRPTLEGSSGSLARSPAPIATVNSTPRADGPRGQQQLSSANFWVEEELQSWRLDFRLFTLQTCLTLSASQKRQTLRKASVTSAMNPREIWLASYAGDAADTASTARERLVTVKFVPPTTSNGANGQSNESNGGHERLRAELRRQAQFSHPNVAAFIGVAWSPQTHLVAVTEYMPQRDLRQWLQRTMASQEHGRGIWSVYKLQMLADLARALVYLHSMHPPVAHGNCNSRNVLLSDELRAKWSDFGNAAGEVLSERDRLAYSAVGSGRWISPEALLGRDTMGASAGARDAGDVYSFGILMAEIDSHELPFSDLMRANRSALPETDILQLIAQGALSPTLSPTCMPAIAELVAACTEYKPARRPSSKQVLMKLQRTLQDAKNAAAKQKAVAVAGASAVPPSPATSADGSGNEQYYYYAGDENKAAPSFV